MQSFPTRDSATKLPATVVYPSSDGEPLAESHEQYKWIVRFAENLDYLIPNAFVGADSFWYPVEGDPTIRVAPDAYVAFGRPKGLRPSYKQWEEENVVPAVVVEVWSPSNRHRHKLAKLTFYERYGVQEFWAWDPQHLELDIYIREGDRLVPTPIEHGFTSPLTGVHLQFDGETLTVTGPDGVPFRSGDEMRVLMAAEQRALAAAKTEAEAAKTEAEAAKTEAEAAKSEVEALRARLRALGLQP